jgi:nicotinate-nucleotide pyrophosphorylase (carboxylating)
MNYPVHRLNSATTQLLAASGLRPLEVEEIAARSLAEDIDGGVDVTTMATVPTSALGVLDFVARSAGVVAGVPVAAAVFDVVNGESISIDYHVADGARVEAGDVVLVITGRIHDLLRGERPALNLLSHLSGIATATAAWVDAVEGTGAQVRDTRKTTPGLRSLEKYAVRCGGGVNHRMNLADAALVKDNHVLAAGGVAEAFAAVRAQFPDIDLEVEVDSMAQLDEVLAAGADLVLLDNFSPEEMRSAVARTAGRARLEASGGLALANAREVAATGVDYLAVGALTHSAPILDIGADLREVN